MNIDKYGVGYCGVGEHSVRINGIKTKEYNCWRSMLERCYDKKCQEKHTSYVRTTVCEEWFNFQNFAQFYNNNYPEIENKKIHLDKDLLQQEIENKVYSPETCIFLPSNVNSFLANNKSDNISGRVGVSWHKNSKKWMSQIACFGDGKSAYLGIFTDIQEASLAYQKARAEQAEKAKQYLRDLNYLPEEIIQLVK